MGDPTGKRQCPECGVNTTVTVYTMKSGREVTEYDACKHTSSKNPLD